MATLQYYVRNAAFAAILPLSLYCTSLSILQTLFLACLVIVIAHYENSDPALLGLPPGPKSLPIVGQLPWFMFQDEPFKWIMKFHERYGPIFTNTVASKHIVVISGYELIKEFSTHPDFQLRPDVGIFHEVTKDLGIIASEGALWKHQRRFLLNSLKNAGMGKLSIEYDIKEELELILKILRKSNGQPIRLQELLEKSTSNIIFKLAFDKRFDYEDQKFIGFIEAMDETFKMMATVGYCTWSKWAKPFSKFILSKLHAKVAILHSKSQEFIDEHRRKLTEEDPKNLLDNYLLEMENEVEDNNEYHKTFFEEQLNQLIIDVFAGGAETASTTIRWALLYMIHNPDIQEKVQKELDDVLGNDGVLSTKTQSKLPYTVATLQEVERLASVVPVTLLRSNDREILWRGYRFPKRSVVGFNIYACHRDPRYWLNPDDFNPSRFIDKEGKVFRPPQLIPFGSGRRSCPGESLGKMEIFLYFATLLRNFRFENPPGKPMPTFKCPKAAVLGPYEYQISCYPR